MLWTSVATQFKATANGAVDRTTNAFQEIEIVGLSWHWLVESCCIQVFYLWILPCSDIILLKTYDSFPATPTHWKVGESSIPFLVPALTRATELISWVTLWFQAGFSNKNAPATRGPRIQVLVQYCMQAVCCQDLWGNTFWILISQILWLVNLPPPP